MKFHGIAVGVVVAIIVIITVTGFALYKVFQATTEGYKALAEYTYVTQKPVFRIDGPYLSGSNATFRLVNLGPSAVTVKQIILYKYQSPTTGPTSALAIPVNKYIPLGDYAEFTIPIDQLAYYMPYPQPLRITIDTDRGLTSTTMTTGQGKLTINIYLPSKASLNPSLGIYPQLVAS